MKLRPMLMKDADKMLEWKNYPETRRFAIVSHDEIRREDHLKWLKLNRRYFKVIMEKDEVCGAVRIQDDEISIWIDREWWGRGIASHIIKRLSREGMVAKIVEGNVGSMRAFIRAGYKPISYNKEDGFYLFKR